MRKVPLIASTSGYMSKKKIATLKAKIAKAKKALR